MKIYRKTFLILFILIITSFSAYAVTTEVIGDWTGISGDCQPDRVSSTVTATCPGDSYISNEPIRFQREAKWYLSNPWTHNTGWQISRNAFGARIEWINGCNYGDNNCSYRTGGIEESSWRANPPQWGLSTCGGSSWYTRLRINMTCESAVTTGTSNYNCYKKFILDNNGNCVNDSLAPVYWGLTSDTSDVCTDKIIVSNVTDTNTQYKYEGDFCVCDNPLYSGVLHPDGSICAYDVDESIEWRQTQQQFHIFDIVNNSVNVISNSEEWFYCNATGTVPTRGITPIDKYASFTDIALTETLASPYNDTDGDLCNDYSEYLAGTDPEDEFDFPTGLECQAEVVLGDPNAGAGSLDLDGEIMGMCPNPFDCLSQIPAQEVQVDSSITQSNQTNLTQDLDNDFSFYIPTKSDSFICYDDGNNNYIAECCMPGSCENPQRAEFNGTYLKKQRAFGNGGLIRTLYNYDTWDGMQVIDGVKYANLSAGISVFAIFRVDTNISDYAFINFFVAFNDPSNLKVALKKGSGNTEILSLNLADYSTTTFSSFRWHKIQIPISDFGSDLSGYDRIKIYADPALPIGHELIVDDIYFENEPYYCSAYYGVWIDELDQAESIKSYVNNTYKWACNEVPSFGWTGTQCCGDDQGNEIITEQYNQYTNTKSCSNIFRGCTTSPRCPCDIDGNIYDCPSNFITTDAVGSVCYDRSYSSGFISFSRYREFTAEEITNTGIFDETYNDTLGGCWEGYAVADDYSVGQAINSRYYDDLLYAKGEFHFCDAGYGLICEYKQSGDCSGTYNFELLKISDSSNAHAAASTENNGYGKLCCDSTKLELINNSEKIYLSSQTNAHVDTTANYSEVVSIGTASSGASCMVSDNFRCERGYSSLFSLSDDANAHIGEPYAYSKNYCCNVPAANTIHIQKYTNSLVANPSSGVCNVPKEKYFCDFDNTWTYKGDKYSLPRNNASSIALNSPDMINLSQQSGVEKTCCPTGWCWDGNECIDGTSSSGETISTFYKVEGYNLSDQGLVCSDGNWVAVEAKYSPHYDDYGFCSSQNACYYEGACYTDGNYVIANGESLDFYCEGGRWTSRTKLLAEEMFKLADSLNSPYSIFCDEYLNVFNDYPGVISHIGNLDDIAVDTREGIKGSVCVLAVDTNQPTYNFVGDTGDLVLIGIPLKQTPDLLTINLDFSGCIYQNDYEDCGNKVYYNNLTKTVIFTQNTNFNWNDATSESLFDRFINWVIDALGMGTKVGAFSEFAGLFNTINKTGNKYTLYNHLYYFEGDNNKQIASIRDYKTRHIGSPTTDYIIYSKYTGFNNLDICEAYDVQFNGTILPISLTLNTAKLITCSNESNSIVQRYQAGSTDNDYWLDLTSKLRPR